MYVGRDSGIGVCGDQVEKSNLTISVEVTGPRQASERKPCSRLSTDAGNGRIAWVKGNGKSVCYQVEVHGPVDSVR